MNPQRRCGPSLHTLPIPQGCTHRHISTRLATIDSQISFNRPGHGGLEPKTTGPSLGSIAMQSDHPPRHSGNRATVSSGIDDSGVAVRLSKEEIKDLPPVDVEGL